MKIIADDRIPFLEGVFEPFVDIEYLPGSEINSSHLGDAEILMVRTRTICNEELLKGSKVRLIASATIGKDHIDEEYCKKNGIEVVNAPGCNSNAVKQWFIAAILNVAIKQNIDLSQKVIGIVGVGHVGEKIVEVCEQLGLYVLLNDPPREQAEGNCIFRDITSIQRECDIISFHTPLTLKGDHKTFHLVDDEFIRKLLPGTILINTSRGEVFSTQAVLKALREKRIGQPILDVWESEPKISEKLLAQSFLATPHVAGYSIEGKANGTASVVKAVARYLDLPLDNWVVDDVSLREPILKTINCEGKAKLDILNEAMEFSYTIEQDDALLRKHPDRFEQLRSEYTYRCEPERYLINLIKPSQEIESALKSIGFHLVKQ